MMVGAHQKRCTPNTRMASTNDAVIHNFDIHLLPIITGTRGIWGLSRRGVAWAIGFTLLFLGIHAILTFPLIRSQLGSYGAQLTTGNNCIRANCLWPCYRRAVFTYSNRMFDDGFPRICIRCYQTTQYAYRLPSLVRDPEYVAQMDNLQTATSATLQFPL